MLKAIFLGMILETVLYPSLKLAGIFLLPFMEGSGNSFWNIACDTYLPESFV